MAFYGLLHCAILELQRNGKMKGPKEVRTLESFMIKYGKPGNVFYSAKPDKNITAISTAYQRKITTERCFIITLETREKPKIETLTKVTLL
jgi:hypothetical protein